MAEALAVALPSGYDDEFVNSVDEDLHCSICHLPLKEAVQTGKCGHRFCRQCLDEHFRRLELNGEPLNCPVDRNTLIRDKDIFPDKAAERKILSFIIKCPSDGCQWTGELRSKTDHLASCPLKIVVCTNNNCSETMTRSNLLKHVTSTCPWRILRCTHCTESHPECKTKAHQTDCEKFPINCPKNCGFVIPREEITSHIDEECPLVNISCPYAHMGCIAKVIPEEEQIRRGEVESHLQIAASLHLDLACAKFNDTQEQLKQTQVQLRNIEKMFEETTRKLEEKVNILEKSMQCSEANSKNSSFTWRIDNFSEVLRKAKSEEETRIESSPFYGCGYKCKLRLYPNGYSAGEGNHLSIFVKIMKGECDATLTWPFQKKVTFKLIDQEESTSNRKNIVSSTTADPELKNFARPLTDHNSGRGFHRFVSHEKMQERRYIVDDTIFIQVRITSPEYM